MKRSGTAIVFLIVWAAVLFAAFVIGICIREVRFQRAGIESKTDIKPAVTDTKPVVSSEVQMSDATDQLVQELSAKRPMLGSEGMMGGRNLPGGQRGGPEAGRGNMGERFANMSDEQRAQMRERFGGARRGGGGGLENLSEEERAKMEEERRQMRERFENMTEEEREKYREEMRERFGGGRQPGGDGQGGREGGRRRPGGR